MTDVLDEVRAHLSAHFEQAGITGEPDAASVTFLGTQSLEVLRFGPGRDGVVHYVSLGCSREPMTDPATIWTYQEYAASATPEQCSTYWVAFKLK